MHRSPPDGARLSRRRRLLGHLARPRTLTLVGVLACAGAAMLPTGAAIDHTAPAAAANRTRRQRASSSPPAICRSSSSRSRSRSGTRPISWRRTRSNPADPEDCKALVGPGADQIPDVLSSYGLRTVDGSCNDLVPGRETFAAADQPFPRLTTPKFRAAEGRPQGFFGPGDPGSASSSYAQKLAGNTVYDTQPRVISNLIVDQTSTNPAAVAAAGFPVRAQGTGPDPVVFPCTTEPDHARRRRRASSRLHARAQDAVHPERDDRRRPVAAVQLAVHVLRPVLRPRRRPDGQEQRHRVRPAEGRRPAADRRSRRHRRHG